ncbi:MAG: hypothetical protein LBG90_03990 [Spirochaetaceae bacterium]|jgi:hypothetical protein|nr:hypothetical protein [Spirochaetaceae bacterium]
MLKEIEDFLRDIWTAVVEFVTGKADIDAYFHKIFKGNTARKGYNAKLEEALNLNLRKEIAETISVHGIQRVLFSHTQAQAGAQTVFLNGQPLSATAERDVIQTFQDAYTQASDPAVKYRAVLQQYKTGKLNSRSLSHVGKVPDIYTKKGLPDYTIRLEGRVIEKSTNPAIRNHNVDMATIERLSELLASPVALLRSLDKTQSKAFITVIDAKDHSGRPVIVVQNPTLKKITSIPSVYGKDDFNGFIERNRKAGTIIAVDKGKATKYVRPAELQLLGGTILDDLSSVSSNSIEKSSVADIFSRDDAGARADQDAVWTRAFKILGAWAEEHSFGSANPVVLSDGLAVSDREIMDFIAPAVSAGLVKGADTKKIKPLNMKDILPEEIMSETETKYWAGIIENEVMQKALFNAACDACEMYSGKEEAREAQLQERIKNAMVTTRIEWQNNIPGQLILTVKMPLGKVGQAIVDNILQVTGIYGKKNKSFRSNTFYKTNNVLDQNRILNTIAKNHKTDISSGNSRRVGWRSSHLFSPYRGNSNQSRRTAL